MAATDAVVVGPEADEEGTNDKSSVEVVVDVLEVEIEVEVEVRELGMLVDGDVLGIDAGEVDCA